jgi:hypothetical protein
MVQKLVLLATAPNTTPARKPSNATVTRLDGAGQSP